MNYEVVCCLMFAAILALTLLLCLACRAKKAARDAWSVLRGDYDLLSNRWHKEMEERLKWERQAHQAQTKLKRTVDSTAGARTMNDLTEEELADLGALENALPRLLAEVRRHRNVRSSICAERADLNRLLGVRPHDSIEETNLRSRLADIETTIKELER